MKPVIRILIGHPFFGRGGAEVATMWLFMALRKKYEIFLVTRGGWDLTELNKIAGTDIKPDEVKLVPIPFNFILKQSKGGHLWHGLYLRYCRNIAPKFDVCISAARPIDWGKKAMHLIADVVWNDDLQNKFATNENKDLKGLKYLIFKLGKTIAGKSTRGIKDDIYIVNSKWTSIISSEYCNNKPVIITPPVVNSFSYINWDKKTNRFICLGRISPEKRIGDIIEILSRVRNRANNIKLHIIGKFDNNDYCNTIQMICSKNREWIKIEGELTGSKKLKLLSESKYGINACQREAFGISTAEMIQAGMITFIPEQGAQKEIVPVEDLHFTSVDDAVEKIIKVLNEEQKQKHILSELRQNTPDFSTERFCREINDVIDDFLNKR